MIEIFRFRVWDAGNKVMSDVDSIELDSNGDVYQIVARINHRLIPYLPNEKRKFLLLQFTGVIDRDGNQIFEGDIVVYPKMMPSGEKEERRNVVEFMPPYFTYARRDGRVIGNIYETPELRGKGNE